MRQALLDWTFDDSLRFILFPLFVGQTVFLGLLMLNSARRRRRARKQFQRMDREQGDKL